MDDRVPADRPSDSGHRAVPHTADTRLEAWSTTPEGCIAEAVRAMVEGFADTSAADVVADRECSVAAGTDEDLLYAVLEEVVSRMDIDGEVPRDVAVEPIRAAGGRRTATVRFRMVDAAAAAPVGAVPKAVALHGLHLEGSPGRWTCRVTVDV
ncbi:archease [Streptomyces sp. XD-27]|uniref:archease n=1 Tax=Streptomyces sp. XD-27 TaxID=3062779 RepID=UPI0026F43935|nr:archease [Streptomyces sp. XD-27]WKX69152.1 archease [Streptomyces sp. XD-27]